MIGRPYFPNTSDNPITSPSKAVGSLRENVQPDRVSQASFLQGTRATFNNRKLSLDVKGS